MTSQEVLQHYWGYAAFRPLQEDIINAVLEGKDVLALLPTGGGKSLCFQVPALVKDGICLVVSPLIALMKDQVENLKKRGIPALSVYSGMSFIETKKTLQNAAHGNYKFLYVSPERIQTRLFQDFLPGMNISLVAIDEAHCISQWGYDFRPPYLQLAELREQLPGVPFLALTASATKEVQDDICVKLAFGQSQLRFQQSFERPQLSYSAFEVPSKQNKILEILNKVKGTAIVYCKSRKHTKDVAEVLLLNGISADFYHAGLSSEERSRKQEAWIGNSIRVMCCTNAFGMGIDKPDVRVVIHYDVPDCLENYYQEAGRAGRDGKRAYAVLLFSNLELQQLTQQADIRFPSKEVIHKLYRDIMNFLQVPAGSGEGQSYDFDMALFTSAFKTDVLTATYGIKVLEQEGIFVFNESFFKPSVLVFNCDRSLLQEIEERQPELDDIIKGLLRSYEGIFDFPCGINETQLSKFVGISREQLIKRLQQLQQLGIVSYQQQKDRPQLFLLLNRMYNDSFVLNLDDHFRRKALFEKRVATIIQFAQSAAGCRSRFIATYFNGTIEKDCGICDNCIRMKETTLTDADFNQVKELLLKAAREKVSLEKLLLPLSSGRKLQCWKVLDYLQQERILFVDREGMLVKNN